MYMLEKTKTKQKIKTYYKKKKKNLVRQKLESKDLILASSKPPSLERDTNIGDRTVQDVCIYKYNNIYRV